jgi:hypothetical protein
MPYEKFNLTLLSNETADLEMQFLDPQDAPYDISGWDFAAQVYSQDGLEHLADWEVTVTDLPTAKIRLRLSAEITRDLPDRAIYDLLVIQADGSQRYWTGGDIRVERGRSRRAD